jgi:hypothetical protein
MGRRGSHRAVLGLEIPYFLRFRKPPILPALKRFPLIPRKRFSQATPLKHFLTLKNISLRNPFPPKHLQIKNYYF